MVGQKGKKKRYSKKVSIKYKDYLFLKSFDVLGGQNG